MGYIYTIQLLNKPVYVGQTIKSVNERWQEHINQAKRHQGFAIHHAMNKYGIENFSIKVLEQTENLNEREKYWIKELHTLISEQGYNLTLGGETSSEKLKKTCYQYDIKGNYIRSFESVSEATRQVSGSDKGITNILRVIQGKLNIAYGYRWSYEFFEKLPALTSNHTGCKKQVYQYTKDQQLIAIYESAVEAARQIGINKKATTIRNAALGHRKTAYGYIWSYSPILNE